MKLLLRSTTCCKFILDLQFMLQNQQYTTVVIEHLILSYIFYFLTNNNNRHIILIRFIKVEFGIKIKQSCLVYGIVVIPLSRPTLRMTCDTIFLCMTHVMCRRPDILWTTLSSRCNKALNHLIASPIGPSHCLLMIFANLSLP